MYNILEQAIIDAKALREAALKNAETAVLEKYSDEVKGAIDIMLEAEVSPVEEAIIVTPGEEAAEPALAAAEGEDLCGCPDAEEEVEWELSLDDLKVMYLFSWAFLVLHNFGILEHLSTYYNKNHGLMFTKFFENFFDFCNNTDSVFSDEVKKVKIFRDNGYDGKGWNDHDKKLGEIIWPVVEESWLRLNYDKQKLIEEITSFIEYLEEKHGFNTSKDFLSTGSSFEFIN